MSSDYTVCPKILAITAFVTYTIGYLHGTSNSPHAVLVLSVTYAGKKGTTISQLGFLYYSA
jgi:hypothetical protein